MKKIFLSILLLCVSSVLFASKLIDQVEVIPVVDNPNPPPAATVFVVAQNKGVTEKHALTPGSFYQANRILSGYVEVEGASSACQSPLSSNTCRYSLPIACINTINQTTLSKQIAAISGAVIPQDNGTFLVNFSCQNT